MSKLTVQQAKEIRSLRGIESQHAIARRYGVSRSVVYHIHAGSIWRDI